MDKTYFANAFSLNMLASFPANIKIEEVNKQQVFFTALGNPNFVSAIGHADTAKQLSNILGIEVSCDRINVKLDVGDNLIVAQYSGPRLPEGTFTLPEGASFRFFRVIFY
jgi:hypothetical protein